MECSLSEVHRVLEGRFGKAAGVLANCRRLIIEFVAHLLCCVEHSFQSELALFEPFFGKFTNPPHSKIEGLRPSCTHLLGSVCLFHVTSPCSCLALGNEMFSRQFHTASDFLGIGIVDRFCKFLRNDRTMQTLEQRRTAQRPSSPS